MALLNTLHLININSWDTGQVAEWLKGLDDALAAYVKHFQMANVNGKRLLILSSGDLENLGIQKLGHREMIIQAIELLCSLQYDLDKENLQMIALKLGCKARSLHNSLRAKQNNSKPLPSPSHTSMSALVAAQRLPLPCLTAISDIVIGCKELVCWLDRPPFDTNTEYVDHRNTVVGWGKELISLTQVENPIANQQKIMDLCLKLAEFCDNLIMDRRDPLLIQPAYLELATIRKRTEEELGMHIHSSYNGTHTIGGIKDESPAYLCGKIEEGDEVVQVNYQVVVGWQLKKLVNALKKNSKEVTLTLKKRPRHIVFGQQAKRANIKKNLQQATFPKAGKRRSKDPDKGLRSPLTDFMTTTLPPPSEPFNERFTTFTTTSLTTTTTTSSGTPESQETDLDTDNDVFRSGSESPGYRLKIEAKPRRATVSGGSPTLVRPHIEIDDLTVSGRPKSYTISIGSPSSESGHSLGSPGSEGLGSPDSDFKWTPRKTNQLSQSVDLDIDSVSGGTTPKASSSPVGPTLTPPSFIQLRVSDSDGDSPKKRKGSDLAALEVAGGSMDNNQPQLVGMRRLNSGIWSEDDQEKKDKTKASPEHVNAESKPDSFDGDYEIKIVGGFPQKVPIGHSGSPSPSQSPAVVMRKPKRHAARRRVSCKDLGRGDCQGWLYKKKEKHGALSGGWGKRWFVLKNKNLYYYKDQSDEKAGGVIYLPAFQISPAQEKSKNKYAFKAHHAGTTFYFASDTNEDRSKWMNKMGLAAISFDTPVGITVAGFHGATISQSPSSASEQSMTYCSDSDDDMSDSHSVDWDSSSEVGSMDNLNKMVTDITKQGVTLDGRTYRDRRSSHLSRIEEVPMLNKEYIKNSKKLISLQRTLKDKECDLALLESVLSTGHITSEVLQSFKENNPNILRRDLPERSSSDESLSDNVIESPSKDKGSTESSSIHSSPRKEEEASIGSPQHDKRDSLV